MKLELKIKGIVVLSMMAMIFVVLVVLPLVLGVSVENVLYVACGVLNMLCLVVYLLLAYFIYKNYKYKKEEV